MKKFISFFTTVVLLAGGLGLFAQNAAAQTKVTGTIVDATGMGVPGATVIQVGTTNGVVADLDGNFTITAPDGADLQVSCIGFQTVNVKAGSSPLNIVLKDDANLLEEVVVTGYGGTVNRSKLTNSIAKVDEKTFEFGAYTTPASALSGAVAGLHIVQTSGNPSASPSITLRGGTNWDGSGSPLVIVDGQLRDGMDDINAEDIESMDVLKDAGATAIYGARASNGVILITTKKGKEGSREINFKAKVGLNYLRMPFELEDAGDYIYWMRRAYAVSPWANQSSLTASNNGLGIGRTALDASTSFNIMSLTSENSYLLKKGWQQMKDPITGADIIYKDTNPVKYNTNNPALSQDYNVNMQGGNEKGNYYAGIGYNDTQGVPLSTYYKRISFVFNGSYKITDWLTSSSTFNFVRTKQRSLPGTQSSEATYFGRIMSTPPTVRYEDEDGNLLLGNSKGDGNQAFEEDKFIKNYENDKFTFGQSFKAQITNWLSFNVNANWYYNEFVQENFTKDYHTNQAMTSLNTGRSSNAEFTRYFTQTYNATLNASKEFGKHSIDAMVGGEFYDRSYFDLYAAGSGAPTDDFMDLEYTSKDEGKRTIDTAHSQYRILSAFGRLNYSYADKYLISATFREDGYSSLLLNRWGFFPGVSAGWVFSKESFVADMLPAMSFGKLRMSYGVNGNASGIGAYTLQGKYSGATYDGNNGFLIGTLPNPSLRWERTNTFELGTDVSFFENKLNAAVTYYNRLTTDKYASLSLPATTGFSSVQTNNGKLRNNGVEIELSGKVLQRKDMSLNLRGNISYNKNKVVALPYNKLNRNRQGGVELYTGKGNETEWFGGYQEGQEPGIVYGYIVDHIARSDADFPAGYKSTVGNSNGKVQYSPEEYAKATPAQQSNGILLTAGDVVWKDINGDGIIDSHDQKVLGNSVPHWTGGFNVDYRWKNLTFVARLDYALGFYLQHGITTGASLPWFIGCMQGQFNMPTMVWDTYTPENPNAKYPRYVWADQLGPGNYNRTSDMFTYRGDYLAFRELTLAYALPEAWAHKIFCRKLSVSVTGQNLGYLTAAYGFASPEASNAITTGYALPRTLLFGVNLTF